MENTNNLTIENIQDLDLQQTLECGQCFRWNRQENGSYFGVVDGKGVTAALNGTTLNISGGSEKMWREYFDLDRDYSVIRECLSSIHPILNDAAKYAPGIRILNQNSWEALCSFIISQNNNIPRIKGIIDRLCENFGTKTVDGCYSFPTPNQLQGVTAEDLSPLRSGFRARYIADAVSKVISGEVDLKKAEALPIEDARKYLMQITGVGIKVADCTLLYGMHRLECFPVDVWMKKAMAVLFPNMNPEDFGEYAGIAQQYIFHYSRMNPQLFKEK